MAGYPLEIFSASKSFVLQVLFSDLCYRSTHKGCLLFHRVVEGDKIGKVAGW